MKIAILGYGKEGKSAESYFQNQNHNIQIFNNFTPDSIAQEDFSGFDLVLRSPSLQPQAGWSSMTRYFFDHCPCPIIGVTGTKGKGTTCSIITAILEALGHKVWLVGNIGNPALDVLDQIQKDDIVVYEMSSFQLWDLEKSPHVAVVLGIEPDHLNVHKDYADYITAKANIAKHQTASDFCIYNQNNPDSTKIARQSSGTQIPYPTTENRGELDKILNSLNIPGQHNRENAEAALHAIAAYLNQDFNDFLTQNSAKIQTALQNFQGLPHRLQYLRELNQVKYYDDNFCTNAASLEVALRAFPDAQIVLIAGGRDKTANADLPEIIELIKKYAKSTVLIGESGHAIYEKLTDSQIANGQFYPVESLSEAIQTAKNLAEALAKNGKSTILLMSPAAASFDMFENVYDRGAQFQQIVRENYNMAEPNSKKLQLLQTELTSAWQKLNLDDKLTRIAELEQAVAEPEIWLNPDDAREKNTELARLSDEVQPWRILKTQINDLGELLELGDTGLEDELTEQVNLLEQQLAELKKALRFTGKYDHNDAILRITAGVGGTEAMDWASMLERMYLRYAEKHNLKATCLERVAGEEAGIKTAVYELAGTDVYGHLKGEHGVHRLVRLSPFNADNLRQTSFALVEILPVIKADTDVKIDDKDLRIDVYHSGGHGGQSVNTTNSAVRITHLPTGTVVAIQNERSQLQNKEKAMEILRGKLVQLQLEQHAESLDKLRAGESAKWGQQIRNYVLQPYKLVKDTRTKHESKDPDAVLDGKIDDFIDAYLEM